MSGRSPRWIREPGVRVGALPVGSTVNLSVTGLLREFLVVHQGKPSSLYDDSCNGTWLLMKDIYENRQWHYVSDNRNSYKASNIHSYLNGMFLGQFDRNIREAIKQVKIPYVDGTGGSAVASGADGLAAKVFLLSGYEIGLTQANYNQYVPIDGACLDYFSGTAATDAKRIAYLNGSAAIWYLRSPHSNTTTDVFDVLISGAMSLCNITNPYGIRPAIILPSNFRISEDRIAEPAA